jgi:branched-chain amino acid transport system permease protein
VRLDGRLGIGAVAVVVPALPWATTDPYWLDIVIQVYVWGAAATAWNVLGGYAGQFSLGHSAFFGIGAYTAGLLLVRLGVSPWLGMGLGAGLAALFAVLLGSLSLRLRGPFFTLATVAVAEVLQILAVYGRGVTGGAEGLAIPFVPGVARIAFEDRRAYALLGAALVLLALLVSVVIERSRVGYYLVAIREDEDAARALGVPVLRMKLVAAVVSAALTAMAGAVYAQYVLWLEPAHLFSIDLSVQLALMAIIGGLGTPIGPLLGAAFVVPAGLLLRGWLGATWAGLDLVVYGGVLIVVVLFARRGLAPALEGGRRRHGVVGGAA